MVTVPYRTRGQRVYHEANPTLSKFAVSIDRPPEGSFTICQDCGACTFSWRKGDQREDGNHLLTMTVRDAILHRAIRIAVETHLTKITEQPSDHLVEVEHRIRIMAPEAKVPYRKISVMLRVE